MSRITDDLTGMKFGELTAMSLVGKTNSGHRLWLCSCSCGGTIEARASSLKAHRIKSCGCKRFIRVRNDITGKKFNRLTAIKELERRNTSGAEHYWLFKCECGQEKECLKSSVVNGQIKSCGCLKLETDGCFSRDHPLEKSLNWKGGRTKNSHGYVHLRLSEEELTKYTTHPPKSGCIGEHIVIMARSLNRPLDTESESVHHKNGIRDDNRLENLELKTRYHGFGQTLEDSINHAIILLKTYKPEMLKEEIC